MMAENPGQQLEAAVASGSHPVLAIKVLLSRALSHGQQSASLPEMHSAHRMPALFLPYSDSQHLVCSDVGACSKMLRIVTTDIP